MAVFEQAYKPYEGALTPEWSRFLIIPRHAYQHVFRSKLFTAFFALSFIPPLIFAILIYLHHNVNTLAGFNIRVSDLLAIDETFFLTYVLVQGMTAFFLAMLVGPQQVSRDLTNNALPLYLCRPFSRTEYVAGKMSIVIILLSAMSWVPGLLLFALQSYLDGWAWFSQHIPIASAIFLGSLVWILLLALLTQTISAWIKWAVASRAALIGIFFIPTIVTGIFNQLFETRWGNLFNLYTLIFNVWSGLFGTFVRQSGHVQEVRGGRIVREVVMNEPPLWASWLALFLISALCLWLLSRKVKAYEVVR